MKRSECLKKFMLCVCLCLIASVFSAFGRVVVPHDNATVVPNCTYVEVPVVGLPNLAVAKCLPADSVAPNDIDVPSCAEESKVPLSIVSIPVVPCVDFAKTGEFFAPWYSCADFAIPVVTTCNRYFSAEKIKTAIFDFDLPATFPTVSAPKLVFRVPVVSEGKFTQTMTYVVWKNGTLTPMSDAKVDIPSIFAAEKILGFVLDSMPSTELISPIVVDGFPAIVVRPSETTAVASVPCAMLFPISLMNNDRVFLIVYREKEKVSSAVVSVDSSLAASIVQRFVSFAANSVPVSVENHISFSAPSVYSAEFAMGLNRFYRYGSFAYPSRLWFLQNAGITAEKRGDMEAADAAYDEFLRVFGEFVKRHCEKEKKRKHNP